MTWKESALDKAPKYNAYLVCVCVVFVSHKRAVRCAACCVRQGYYGFIIMGGNVEMRIDYRLREHNYQLFTIRVGIFAFSIAHSEYAILNEACVN